MKNRKCLLILLLVLFMPLMVDALDEYVFLAWNGSVGSEYVICDDELKYVVAHEIGHNISTGLYNRLNENTFRTPKKYEKWNNEFMKRVEKRYKDTKKKYQKN